MQLRQTEDGINPMTSTTFEKGRWSLAARAPHFSGSVFLRETVRAARNWTGSFGFVTALRRQSTVASPTPGHGLAAISSYAQFIAAHPDMPTSHKDRFLGEIVRCCRELRTASA
jgi:hypothetical protein